MTDELKQRLRYNVALAQFRKHPPMIWKRNDFFLLIQAGLLAFTVNQDRAADSKLVVMAYLAGLLLAFVWLWVTIAGRKLLWIWHDIVLECEQSLYETDDLKGPFRIAKEEGEGQEIKNFMVNITLALIVLSGGFVIMWAALIILRFFYR